MLITKTTGNKLSYIHKTEYYSATKKEQNDDTFNDMEKWPKCYVDQESANRMFPFIKSSKNR